MTPAATGAISFRPSTAADDPRIREALASAGLPAEDVETGRQDYVVALDGERLVGAVGLEVAGADGLARSLVVAPAWRGRGLSHALHDRLLALARARGVRTLYLLTTTVEAYAARKGFERIGRSEVPPALLALPQFRSLCPGASACMRLRLA
jgi:amino-acid N-acetyltransferase